MISCSGLTKSFSGHSVLKELSYHFEDTGFYLLLGESGSGKTTFLNILSGLLAFESGSVAWGGMIFSERVDISAIRQDYDYITQDTFFVEFLSVEDNMRLILDDDQKIFELLEQFGLKGASLQKPDTLSGGERERLAVARALLGGKRVLFLDEPTAALDEDNKRAVFELLSQLKSNILIICATHDKQAEAYADHVLYFFKEGERPESVTYADTATADAEKVKQNADKTAVSGKAVSEAALPDGFIAEAFRQDSKKAKPGRFLRKWFVDGGRNRRTMALFTFFLVIAMCFCVFSDNPENKLESSIENLYGLNMFTVKTVGGLSWEDIAPDMEGIRDVVLNYSFTCPDGNEDLSGEVLMRPQPDYELSLNTLPFDGEVFRLSDRIKYGTYFTEENQIILSYEMANALYPSSPERLIGQRFNKKLYGLGGIDFEVVGIFDKFSETDKVYLEGLDIFVAKGEEYAAENYEDMYFINSKLTARFEEDENFYGGKSRQRGYHIFFDSYKAMKEYYDKYEAALLQRSGYSVYYSMVNRSMYELFKSLFYVTLPTAVFVMIFATFFYISLRRTEFVYNSRFIAAFEYAGYSKKKTLRCFIFLNILELIKAYAVAFALSLFIAWAVNLINKRYLFVDFQIFTVNIPMLLAFLVFMIAAAILYANILFHRVRLSTWYEGMIEGRDLI